MDLIQSYIVPAALGISLSACCGFRVFIPLLVASVAAKSGYLPLSAGFGWMNSWAAIICFGLASAVEIVAYYFPVIDNLLDTITSPSAFVAGTALSASVFTEFNPMTKWALAIIAGGGTASVIQAGTGVLRLSSTKFTAGLGNGVIATAENIFSAVGSVLALLIPIAVFLFFVAFFGGCIYLIGSRFFKTPKAQE